MGEEGDDDEADDDELDERGGWGGGGWAAGDARGRAADALLTLAAAGTSMLADVGTSMHAAEPDYSEAAPRARKPPWARGPADSPAPRPPTPEAAVSQSTDLASIKARIQSALAGGIHERNEIVCFVSNAFGKSKISRERIVDVLRKSQRVAEPPWWQRGESYYLVGDGQEEELGRSPAVRRVVRLRVTAADFGRDAMMAAALASPFSYKIYMYTHTHTHTHTRSRKSSFLLSLFLFSLSLVFSL